MSGFHWELATTERKILSLTFFFLFFLSKDSSVPHLLKENNIIVFQYVFRGVFFHVPIIHWFFFPRQLRFFIKPSGEFTKYSTTSKNQWASYQTRPTTDIAWIHGPHITTGFKGPDNHLGFKGLTNAERLLTSVGRQIYSALNVSCEKTGD